MLDAVQTEMPFGKRGGNITITDRILTALDEARKRKMSARVAVKFVNDMLRRDCPEMKVLVPFMITEANTFGEWHVTVQEGNKQVLISSED